MVVLALGRAWRAVDAAPHALARCRPGRAMEVRLVAVTREARHQFAWQPRAGLLARLVARGQTPAIDATADVPPGSVTLWLWVNQPLVGAPASVKVVDDTRREYVNGPLVQPVASAAAPWGEATLVWVALTRFDQSAQRLTFTIPLAQAPNAARFEVDGPAATVVAEEPRSEYPQVAGNAAADIRLWQLQRVGPRLAELLPFGMVPQPAAHLVFADLDVRDREAAARPGRWRLELTNATTDRGEPMAVAARQDGLFYLSHGRPATDLVAVTLKAKATKIATGQASVVFRHLALPAETGATREWQQPAAVAPFAGGAFTVRAGTRVSASLLRVEVVGRAPGESMATLGFRAALDQQGRSLGLHGDPGITPTQETRHGGQTTWHWSYDVQVKPDSTNLALAFRLDYKVAAASAAGTFCAALQPAGPGAGLGLLIEPRGKPARFVVTQVVPDSMAAQTSLAPGDEVVTLDGAPPAQAPRLLLRRRPGQQIEIVFRRGGRTLAGMVGLDARR